MRNPDRLYKLYIDLMNEHKNNFPDWRFTQLMLNFFSWYRQKFNNDGFYMEDEIFKNKFKDFINEMKGE